MSDEVKDPQRKVPRSMVYSIVINGGTALAFMIVLLFTLGDLETVLATKTGYPIIEVFYQSTQSKAGATVLMSMLTFNGLVSLFSCLASVSRLTWAFARDHGLPFSDFFGYVSSSPPFTSFSTTHKKIQVHPTLRVPLNSLWLVTSVMVLLSLINIGSTTAFYGIISLSLIALYISYVVPIIFIVIKKLNREHIAYGPWKLGRFGLVVNIFAILYGIFIIIFLPFPPTLPVSAANLNWVGPVLGIVILFALGDWFVSGRKRFSVPTEKHDASWAN
jgi:choline transport protein